MSRNSFSQWVNVLLASRTWRKSLRGGARLRGVPRRVLRLEELEHRLVLSPAPFVSLAPHQDFATGESPRCVSLGDLNGDGKPDMAVANYSSDTVAVLLNTTAPGAATPSFADEQDFATGAYPRCVSVGDLNGDGKPDLAVANVNSNTVSVLLNTTVPGALTPSFADKQDFATGGMPLSVSVGDLNGDGKPDLAVANFDSNTVSVLLNTAAPGATAPSFADQQGFATDSMPSSVSVGDLNGDGKPDLAVANAGSDTLSVLLNTTAPGAATPSFAPKQDLAIGGWPHSVSVGDLNADGKLDLVAEEPSADAVAVFLNTTAPGATTLNFAPMQEFGTGAEPGSVPLGDLNADGKPDLAVANWFSNTVSVLLNTTAPGATTPSFAPKQDFAVGSNPWWVSLGDLNGDGKPDLAVANNSSNSVSVLLNTTVAQAVPTVSVTLAGGTYNGSPFAATAATVTGVAPDGILANFGDACLSYTYYAGGTPLAGAPKNAGTYSVVAHYTSNNPAYTSASSSQVPFTIAPATLTVTAANKSRAYGDVDPLFTALYSGFAGSETLPTSGVSGSPSFTTNAGAASPPGHYTITPALGTLAARNYRFAFVSGTLTIDSGIAGPTSGVEGTAVTLIGSVNQTAPSYAWSVVRDGNFVIRGSGPSFSFTPNDQGTYVATLTATDSDGSILSLTHTTAVANVAPTAAISGPTSGTEGTAIRLTGSATDASSVDTAAGFGYVWSVTKDGNAYATASGSSLTFTPNDQGSYVATLTASDKDGGSGVTTRSIAVANVAPTAAISKLGNVTEGMTVTLTGSATDPSSADTAAVVTLAWTLSKNGAPYGTASGAGLTFTPDDNGTYVATLTATDKDGGAGTATRTLIVTDVLPTAAISGPTSGTEGAPLTLTGSATDPSSVDTQGGFTYTWSVTRNGAFYIRGSGPGLTFSPNDQGTYVATLSASDKDGSGTLARTIIVSNVAPTASLSNNGPVPAGSTALVAFSAVFDPSSLDATAGLHYAYDFDNNGTFEVGNGAYAGSVTASSATVPASYLAAPGTRVVHARIIDKDEGHTDYTTSITVGSPLLAQDVAPGGSANIVGQAAAQSLLVAALARWSATGADVSSLRNTSLRIADLPGATLGLATAAEHTIWLDIDAAGHGWFIDPTPQWDEEFAAQTAGALQACDARAAHRMDLLTVIAHELGHLLGRADLDPTGSAGNVMDATLGDGIRRLPTADPSAARIGTRQSAIGAELLAAQLQTRDDLFAGWDDGSDGLSVRFKRFRQ